MKCFSVSLFLSLTTLLHGANADASLIRHYAFDRVSDEVPNQAGDKKGTLVITTVDPYFNKSFHPQTNTDLPRWTEGRLADKPALEIRSADGSVMNSQFYGTKTGVFTVEAWIRLHSARGEKRDAFLFSSGSGFGSGWNLKASTWETSFRLGRPANEGGDISLSAPPLSPNVWHQLTAVLDKNTLCLYVDGELVGTKDFEGVFKQISTPEGRLTLFPEESQGGLKIGAINSEGNSLFFDCDDLRIYDRVLSPEEVRAQYQSSRPPQSAEEQAKHHLAFLEQRSLSDKILIEIPRDTYGYFPAGETLPLTVSAPGSSGDLTVDVTIAAIDQKPTFQEQKNLPSSDPASLTWDLPIPKTRGLYQIEVTVKNAQGVVAGKSFPIGATVPLIPIAQRPSTSPLGGHQIFARHNEDLALGAKIERNIPYIPKYPDGRPNLENLDIAVERVRESGLDLMLTVQPYYDPPGVTSPEIPEWGGWLRAIVERYKGKVKYWEILNEPNAHKITPKEYVELLKTAHDVIREIDPDALIVGICGVTNYPEWTDDVLTAGGGGYFDILSFHNYIGSSPISGWKSQQKIERTREILRKHLGKDIPMWNSEGGIHQPRRIDGRSLTNEQLLERYPRGNQQEDGIVIVPADAISMVTEHVGACWQIQSILLDAALGVEKWFILQGASNFYPHSGASNGSPSLKGVAYAALASVVSNMKSAELIPLSVTSSAGVLVTASDGKRTSALFADIPATRSFVVNRNGTWRGMDYLGNPLQWEAKNNLLTVSFGMEPIYIFDVPADFHEAPFLAIKDFPALVSPGEEAKGTLTVTNLFSAPLKGSLKMASSQSTFTVEEVINLDPGAKAEIPFTLKAGPLKRGDHAFTVTLSQEGREVASSERSFSSEGVARGIPLLDREISLNADPADWEGIPAEISDTASNVVLGRPPVGYYDPATWQGPEDLSFKVQTAWRPDQGIYFLLTVKDEAFKPVPPESLDRAFLQDTLEFFFDGRPLQEQAPVYSFGVEQNVIVPTLGDKAQSALRKSFARYGDSIDVEAVSRQTSDGYIIEGLIRPRKNAPFKLIPGTRIGMDFVIDDAGPGTMTRKTQMALHGSANNSSDTSGFGRYYLMQRAAGTMENLLRNSKFEPATDGKITDWNFVNDAGDAGKGFQTGAVEIDGQRALWISAPRDVQAQGWWLQSLPVEPDTAYAVSYRVKGVGEGKFKWANSGGGVYFLGAKGEWLGWQPIGSSPPTGQWGTYSQRILPPTGTHTMGFRFTSSANGVKDRVDFYCTDISITAESLNR